MKQFPFFVYGTLKPGHGNYRRLLAGRTVLEQPATLPGAVIYTQDKEGRGIPYLVHYPWKREPVVYGCLITVERGAYAAALKNLDVLEGYNPKDSITSHYLRRQVQVVAGGERHTVWVYLAGLWAERQILYNHRLYRLESGIWGAR